jgi:3-(3-hydroxy-phenyl)propionate hydroxylase
VSRWDAPRDSVIRDRALLDPGNQTAQRYGCAADTVVLVRPDDHIAAIAPMTPDAALAAYRATISAHHREAVPA